jgi:hypothetical protein
MIQIAAINDASTIKFILLRTACDSELQEMLIELARGEIFLEHF